MRSAVIGKRSIRTPAALKIPFAIAGATPVPQSFSHRMLAQTPIKTKSGSVRITDTKLFPASRTIAAALVEVEPGGMRELHWHPNTDEWQYYIAGQARMGVFAASGQARTFDFFENDVGFVPFAMGHYIENTGTTTLKFLEIFKSDYYADVSLDQWLALTPPDGAWCQRCRFGARIGNEVRQVTDPLTRPTFGNCVVDNGPCVPDQMIAAPIVFQIVIPPEPSDMHKVAARAQPSGAAHPSQHDVGTPSGDLARECEPGRQIEDAAEGEYRQQVRAVVADVPDSLQAERAGGEVRQKNKADEGRGAVSPYLPSGDAFFSAAGPERGGGPGDDPSDPGDSKQRTRTHCGSSSEEMCIDLNLMWNPRWVPHLLRQG